MSSELSAKPPPFDIAAMSSDQNISSCYEAAETAIKQAEILRRRQPIPDLNEMRYAGYYALRYAELPAGDKRGEECRKRVCQGVNRFLARSRKYG